MDADAERPASLRCSSCDAPIFWALTSRERRIPMNADPVEEVGTGFYAIDWPTGPDGEPRAIPLRAYSVTHFATCPNAAQHRRR